MLKAVLDTNVLINGVQDEASYSFRIIKAVIEGKITAVVNRQLQQENRLKTSELIKDQGYKEFLENYYYKTEFIKRYSHENVVEWDEEDNKLIAAALDGGAKFVVTEDRDLLFLGEHKGIRMVTPQEFWRYYQENEEGASSDWQDWMKNLIGK
ncbi:MAG: putative toxin-antitoxin system toxin component, PIN family [Candidatus Kerfeldbacteria bacterium CG_4_10_14_0_8_um_filter_42_10]|uniref:Putative toxin-antitoxin system toxin component, PIN family n=1 Tax=Candidatus Kerfeldbacteria bacterium CG_4_10_14_0_8_um_filter_42_10 TaxID=2014248 RepID=A0A2M7RHZ2_9BACT|nr:MAG: putative toxin-antitoxin system toxin component, PIN family [Candidatus Kerfeldbacteria bacterium CG_4_10_14_0_8_um_filter_42_10]